MHQRALKLLSSRPLLLSPHLCEWQLARAQGLVSKDGKLALGPLMSHASTKANQNDPLILGVGDEVAGEGREWAGRKERAGQLMATLKQRSRRAALRGEAQREGEKGDTRMSGLEKEDMAKKARGAGGEEQAGAVAGEGGKVKGSGSSGVTRAKEDAENERRRESVRQGMIHAWKAYETYAWGMDELQVGKQHVAEYG